MKKTFNINIAGIPFVINEDAYTLLNDYINTIEHAFRNVDGETELVNDIEARIAELLMQATEEGSPIITVTDVEKVIERVGNPEEFAEEETITAEDEDGTTRTVEMESETVTPPPYIPNPPHIVKRLYRDPQNCMLGGVCSGLAWYLGWDVTLVRLLVVILTILSFATIAVAYLILWIVVPEARTPLQRMQMMGEQPTMENIAKTVTDNFKDSEETQASAAPAYSADLLSSSTSFIVKLLAVIGVPILLGLALGLIGCVVFLIAWGSSLIFGTGMPFDQESYNDPWVSRIVFWGVLCGIGWCILLGIPLMYFVRRGLNFIPFSRPVWRICNFIWGISLIIAGLGTGMVISSTSEQANFQNQRWKEKRKAERMEEENYRNGIKSLSAEEIQSQIDYLNERADVLQKQADHFLEAADSLCERAKEMKRKAEAYPDNQQYKRLAKQYEANSKNAKNKADKIHKQAKKLTDKSEMIWEILIEKQENSIDAKVRENADSTTN